jgi:hypothetical protein
MQKPTSSRISSAKPSPGSTPVLLDNEDLGKAFYEKLTERSGIHTTSCPKCSFIMSREQRNVAEQKTYPSEVPMHSPIFLIAICLCLLTACSSNTEQKLLSQAAQFAQNKNYKEAIITLDKIHSSSKEYKLGQTKKIEYLASMLPDATQQAATSATDAMFDLSSRKNLGIDYVSYSEKLGEAYSAIERFGREENSSEHPAYKNLNDSFQSYFLVSQVWKCLSEYGNISSSFDSDFNASLCNGEQLIRDYGVVPISREIDGKKETFIVLNQALSAVWNKGDEYLKKADEINRALEKAKR